MFTIEFKDKRKRAAAQIKIIASARAYYLSDSDESVRIPRKNKERTSVLRSNKPQKNITSTTVYIAIVCFARRQECLSESTCPIVPRNAQACVTTGPSRMQWGDLW